MRYFNCIIPIKTDKTFIYGADDELSGSIKRGSVVNLVFRNTDTAAIVLSEAKDSERIGINSINMIQSVKTDISLNEGFIKLMDWIAEYYFTEAGIVWRSALPPLRNNVRRYVYNKGDSAALEEIREMTQDAPLAKGTIEKILRKYKLDFSMLLKNGNIIENIYPYREPEGNHTELNDEQKSAFETVKACIDRNEYSASLLYGPPASGKSEVYMHLIEHVLKHTDRNVMVLFPEIGLAQVMFEKITDRFGTNSAAMMHSELSDGERSFVFNAAASGKLRILVGTRSAVYIPLNNIGLIVIDEEQDISYRQTDAMPHYSGRDTAVYNGVINNSAVLLVSATPSAETVYNTESGKYKRIDLSRPFKGRKPKIEIYPKNSNEFPVHFMDALSDTMGGNEQSVIFLNRRGFLNLYRCSNCNEYFKCPDCSVSYSYHRQEGKYICHYCGSTAHAKSVCGKCGGELKSTGVWGTEKVEQIISRMYPDARIDRLDTDTVTRKGSRKAVIDRMTAGETDMLIGTQMVSKGYDMPDVMLVLMLNADAMINMPDFRSEERFMQLLVQTAGRAGRRDRQGRIIIEAAGLNDSLKQYIYNLDYMGFIKEELKRRESADFPPFRRMLQITVRNTDREKASKDIFRLYEKASQAKGMTVYPPVPAPVFKLAKYYRYNIHITYRQFGRVKGLIHALKHTGIRFTVDNG